MAGLLANVLYLADVIGFTCLNVFSRHRKYRAIFSTLVKRQIERVNLKRVKLSFSETAEAYQVPPRSFRPAVK
jgi:hypothetical protein